MIRRLTRLFRGSPEPCAHDWAVEFFERTDALMYRVDSCTACPQWRVEVLERYE